MRQNGGLAVALVTTGLAICCTQAFVAPGSGLRPTSSDHQKRQQGLLHRDTCLHSNTHRRTCLTNPSRTRPLGTTVGDTDGLVDFEDDDCEVQVMASRPMEGRRRRRVRNTEGGGGERRWAALRRSVIRGMASLAALTLGTTMLSGMSAEAQNRMGKSMPGALSTARASVFKPFSRRTVEEKLGNLPAFMVTNFKGSPYLVASEERGVQVCFPYLLFCRGTVGSLSLPYGLVVQTL